MSKHFVWQNTEIDYESYRADFEEIHGHLEDGELWELVNQYVLDTLDDEKANLSFTKVPESLVIIADLGLWDGHRSGWKDLGRNHTLADCITIDSGCEYSEFFVDDDGDFVSNQHHHDGVNHLIYRSISTEILEELKEEGVDSGKLLEVSKPIGDLVKKVYGWE